MMERNALLEVNGLEIKYLGAHSALKAVAV